MSRSLPPVSLLPGLYDPLLFSGGSPVEVVDHEDRPLLIMDARSAEAQKLPQRRITAALFDHAGRIRLSRRALGETGGHVWDFSAQGAVLAGEAREDAAARLLEEQLGLSGLQPVPRAELPPQVTGGAQWVSLFVAGRRGAHLERIQGAGMFLDKDERTGLAEHFPELLSPGLLYCIKSGLL